MELGTVRIYTKAAVTPGARNPKSGQFIAQVHAAAREAVTEMAHAAESYLLEYFGRHFRSGATLQSVDVRGFSSTQARIKVGANVGFLEEGVPRHDIAVFKRYAFNPDPRSGKFGRFRVKNPNYPGPIIFDHPGVTQESPVAKSRELAEKVGDAVLPRLLP